MRTEAQKKARIEHETKIAADYKIYYSEHPEDPRECCKCGQTKALRKFLPTYAFKNICKDCHKGSVQSWRNSNPKARQAIQQKSFAKSAELMRAHKSRACSACHREFPFYVMDFHHPAEKTVNISQLYQKAEARINTEIAKCVLLCANCHRDETRGREHLVPVLKNRPQTPEIVEIPAIPGDPMKTCARCRTEKHEANFTLLKTGYRHSYCKRCLREVNRALGADRKTTERSGKSLLRSLKDGKACADCGQTHPFWRLDFDHIRGEKRMNLSRLQNASVKVILEEVSKCDLVCANCHRVRTYNRARQARTPILNPITVRHIDVQKVLLRRSSDERAGEVLKSVHYAGYGRSASILYEAVYGDEIVAVAKLSPPVRKEVATSMGLDHSEVLELDRFCIVPEFQVQNLASRVLGLAVKAVRRDAPDVSTLVSFADLAQGHLGGIYRAANWAHAGMAAASYEYIDADGKRINKKTLYNFACKAGMKEREYASLRGLSRSKLPGKHKFVYRLR